TACWPRSWPRPRTRICRRSVSSSSNRTTVRRRLQRAGRLPQHVSTPPSGGVFFLVLLPSAGDTERNRDEVLPAASDGRRALSAGNRSPLGQGRCAGPDREAG